MVLVENLIISFLSTFALKEMAVTSTFNWWLCSIFQAA